MFDLCFGCLEQKNIISKKPFFLCEKCLNNVIHYNNYKNNIEYIISGLDKLNIKIHNKFDIRLCDKEELYNIYNRKNRSKNNILLGLLKKNNIYILNNLPLNLFINTLSHELTHVWQKENCFKYRPKYLYEGFADFISFYICYISGLKIETKRLLYYNIFINTKGLLFFLDKFNFKEIYMYFAVPESSTNIKSMNSKSPVKLPDWLKQLGKDFLKKK